MGGVLVVDEGHRNQKRKGINSKGFKRSISMDTSLPAQPGGAVVWKPWLGGGELLPRENRSRDARPKVPVSQGVCRSS